MCDAQHPLADEQGLDAHGVDVRGDHVQLRLRGELHGQAIRYPGGHVGALGWEIKYIIKVFGGGFFTQNAVKRKKILNYCSCKICSYNFWTIDLNIDLNKIFSIDQKIFIVYDLVKNVYIFG